MLHLLHSLFLISNANAGQQIAAMVMTVTGALSVGSIHCQQQRALQAIKGEK